MLSAGKREQPGAPRIDWRAMRRSLPIIALIALSLAVHRTAFGGWWLYDDPQLVIEAIRQSIVSLFFRPAEYAHFATHTFTPLLPISFKLDLAFAGVAPRAFYVHQVVALTLAALLLFVLLRRYVESAFAFCGAALFLTSWAAIYAARTLMIRHYVEGLVVALAALIAFGARRDRTAAFFYLLALLSKEVFAPLPLLFLLQARFDEDDWPTAIRRMLAPAISLALFLVWRWRMTGLVGDYAAFPTRHDFAVWPRAIWSHAIGPEPRFAALVWLVALLAIVAAFVVRFRLRSIAFIAAIVVVGVLPVVPLAANFEWRYSFALIAFGIAGLTVAAGLTGRILLLPLGALAVASAVVAPAQGRAYDALTRGGRGEGEYVWSRPANAPALAASTPGWYLEGLAWLRTWDHRGAAPRFFFSRYPLVLGEINAYDAVALDPANGAPLTMATLPPMHPLIATFGTPVQWREEASHFAAAAPLSVWFRIASHDASWRLGPAANGEFVFLTDPDWNAIPIGADGTRRVPAARERQWFRIVRRDAVTKVWTISPRLPVPFEEQTTSWSR